MISGLLLGNVVSYSLTPFNGLGLPGLCVLVAIFILAKDNGDMTISPLVGVSYATFVGWVIFVDLFVAKAYEAFVRDLLWLVVPILVISFRNFYLNRNEIMLGVRLVSLLLIGYVFLEISLWYSQEIDQHFVPLWGYSRHLGMSAGWIALILSWPYDNRQWSSACLSETWRVARAMAVALVVWSGTRSAMLGLALALLIVVIANRKKVMEWIAWRDILYGLGWYVCLPLGPDSGLLIGRIRQSMELASPDTLASGRLTVWLNTMRGLRDNDALLTGLGGNGFLRLQQDFGYFVLNGSHIQPHNFAIQLLSDWGIVGALLFLTVFLLIFRRHFQFPAPPQQPAIWVVFFYVACIAGLDAGLYHVEFVSYALFAIVLLVPARVDVLAGWKIGRTSANVVALSVLIAALPLWGHRIHWPHYFPT